MASHVSTSAGRPDARTESPGIEIRLPWGAWYADATHRLRAPAEWTVDVLSPAGGEALASDEIARALSRPLASRGLPELARGKRTACVAVDDLARPTRISQILPHVAALLHEGGVCDENIRIVVATGSHNGLSPSELEWKVGSEAMSRFHVECHDCSGDLCPTGIQYGDDELRVNRSFLEADLKITIGSVLPHPFAGFSGGAKLLLPGLTDLRSIQRSHKFVQLGLRGGADPNANGFRTEAEAIARYLGLAFTVCVVSNMRRETVSVHAGDLVAAHRSACESAREVYRTALSATYDCAIVNAFPKDIDLIQSEAAFVVWKTARAPVVREQGIVVLTSAASTGLGRHGLFEPGGASYRRPEPKRWLGDRELWIYTPNIAPAVAHQLFWSGYPVFRDGAELMEALARRLPQKPRLAVFPCGPAQCLVDQRQ
jgi:nickel-dependent lactate racemase